MTRGWKPWEIDAAAEHTLNGLRDYLVRTGVFAAPAAATIPGDGEEPDDDDTHIHATLERAAMRFG